MNSTIERGMNVVRESERELRELVSHAASAGDYESVITLTSWARSLATLAASPGGCGRSGGSTTAAEKAPSISRRGPRGARPMVQTKRPVKSDYPKFLRRGDDLVKVGWSRRAKAEYEHKAPNGVVTLVAQAIAKAGSNGELTPTDKLLSAIASGGAMEVPEYQVYVVLAWLRRLDLVTKRGRQGYTVYKPNEVVANVALSWDRLPTGK